MIRILWEDSRQLARPKIYGPDQILAACVADDLRCDYKAAFALFESEPLNGNGNVKRRLARDAHALGITPLCAVFDRDKISALFPNSTSCKSGICTSIRSTISGNYYLVLLHDNMETLVSAACNVLGAPVPQKKLPSERDGILARLAFNGTVSERTDVRNAVDGFDRLVKWVANTSRDATP